MRILVARTPALHVDRIRGIYMAAAGRHACPDRHYRLVQQVEVLLHVARLSLEFYGIRRVLHGAE